MVVLLCSTSTLFAQFDSVSKSYQQEFDAFKKQINNDFKGFKSKNDSIFYGFLSQSWQKYSLMQQQPVLRPKPKQQPKSKAPSSPGMQIIYQEIIDKAKLETHEVYMDDPQMYHKMNRVNKTTSSFYGLQVQFSEYDKNITAINSAKEEDVAQFYKEMSLHKDMDLLVEELLKAKADYYLNDWAFVDMLSYVAKKNYSSPNEQALFMWYILLDTDYQVRIGFNKEDLYLLLSFVNPVYNKPYLIIENQKYYLYNPSKQNLSSIHSYAINHPDKKRALSLLSKQLPKFPGNEAVREIQFNGKDFQLAYNQSLIAFYKTYPLTELAVYLNTPLSEIAKDRLLKLISPVLKNKSQKEKINFLLHFIQYAFPYERDEEQFAAEKYMFAEEALSYPYTDCEDRVILLDKLVKEYTDLSTIVLLYPDHVVLGVESDTIINASYVLYKQKNYYIADPTYLGAEFGVIMEEYKNISPQILIF